MNFAEKRDHLNYVDGMRAICALFVVLHHTYQCVFTIGRTHTLGGLGVLLSPFAYGHLAVGIFIVISGFCLTLPCGGNLVMRRSTTEFYVSRAWRILPPLFAALVLGLVVKLAMASVSDWKRYFEAIPANVLLLQDVSPHFNVLNGPSWSVAVEFKIYLAFPLLLLLFKKYNEYAVLLITGIFAFAVSWAFKAAKPDFNLINFCPWYLSLFSMGMWAARRSQSEDCSRRAGHRWLITGTLAFMALLMLHPITRVDDLSFTSAAPFVDTAIGTLTAAAIYLIYAPRSAAGCTARRLLSAPFLVWLGKRSYSLYLVHLPLLLGLQFLLPMKHFPRCYALTMFLLGVPVCISFANFFFLKIESHFMQLPARWRDRFSQSAGHAMRPAPSPPWHS